MFDAATILMYRWGHRRRRHYDETKLCNASIISVSNRYAVPVVDVSGRYLKAMETNFSGSLENLSCHTPLPVRIIGPFYMFTCPKDNRPILHIRMSYPRVLIVPQIDEEYSLLRIDQNTDFREIRVAKYHSLTFGQKDISNGI